MDGAGLDCADLLRVLLDGEDERVVAVQHDGLDAALGLLVLLLGWLGGAGRRAFSAAFVAPSHVGVQAASGLVPEVGATLSLHMVGLGAVEAHCVATALALALAFGLALGLAFAFGFALALGDRVDLHGVAEFPCPPRLQVVRHLGLHLGEGVQPGGVHHDVVADLVVDQMLRDRGDLDRVGDVVAALLLVQVELAAPLHDGQHDVLARTWVEHLLQHALEAVRDARLELVRE